MGCSRHRAYDRIWAPYLGLYAEDAIRLAGVKSGDRVLDVAAGPGTLTLMAAKLGAQVTATDLPRNDRAASQACGLSETCQSDR